MRPISFIVTALCVTLGCSQALADRICPTSSLGVRDFSQPCFEVRGNTMYPTIPNTTIRDYNQPGLTIQREYDRTLIQPTYPGTNIPDYSRPGYSIDRYRY